MILVIEDDPVVAGVIAAVLKRRNAAFAVVATAAEGYDRAQRTTPDLVICDLGLPDGSGLDLIRNLRALPSMLDVPLIVCTADSTRETVIKALSVGATDFIAKPIDPVTFEARVIKALRGRQAVPA
jgi:DNA-binding response OmpR family regulator